MPYSPYYTFAIPITERLTAFVGAAEQPALRKVQSLGGTP